MPSYHAFGVTIESNRPISALEGCPPPTADSEVEHSPIRVDLRRDSTAPTASVAETEWHASVADDAGHLLRVTRDTRGDFRLRYTDGTWFVIAADGGSVTGRWPAGLSLEDTVEYLLGPVIGFALRLRGVVCLHASAITVDDACFAFLAPAGYGKSTTAAACALLGFPILTDDVLALRERDGRFLVLPGYPRVRLWPEAVGNLFGSVDALPRLTPDNESWTKRYLDLCEPGRVFQTEPLPLRCIYIPEPTDLSGPSFEPLSRAQALVNLIGNVYSLSRPETAQRAREFDLLGRVARTIPVKRFRYRRDFRYLTGQCRALARDCTRIESESRAQPPGER